jgi:hypothetical protein
MVRRRKTKRTEGIITGPSVLVTELDEESLSNAALKLPFARTYTPKLLAEHYPNGFEGCLVIREDIAPFTADNTKTFPVYLAYTLGMLDPYKDLFVVSQDQDGALTSAILHHGATLLYDDTLVGYNAGSQRPRGEKMDTSITPIIDPGYLIKLVKEHRYLTTLTYLGKLPDEVFDRLAHYLFFSSIYALQRAT